jgi:uncharacterized membrane protein
MVILALVVGWLVIGWLPSRVHKHYVFSRYGPEYWEKSDEVLYLLTALIGPLFIISFLLARWGFDRLDREDYGNTIPWGWKW